MRSRLRLLLLASSTLAIATSTIVACSSSKQAEDIPFEDDDDDGGRRRDRGPVPETGNPSPDATPTPGRIYAHTRDQLYLFEPYSKTITFIGKFSCVADDDSVLDIALDRTGLMYGTTYEHFISINPINATCTVVGSLGLNQYPNSLSFVPQGTVDKNAETLVGYAFDHNDNATIYTRLNLQTGEMNDLPGYINPTGAPVEYALAGDLISLLRSNNKTYAILKQLGDGGTGSDKLAEIDPSTGKLKAILGDLGYRGTYGFGYWAGKGYGFLSDGRVIEIDMSDGSGAVVATLTAEAGAAAWYGAGVTTDSPVR